MDQSKGMFKRPVLICLAHAFSILHFEYPEWETAGYQVSDWTVQRLCCWTSSGSFTIQGVLCFPTWWLTGLFPCSCSRVGCFRSSISRYILIYYTALFDIVPVTDSWLLSSCDHSFSDSSQLQGSEGKRNPKASERFGSLQRHLCCIKLVKANCLGNPEAKKMGRDVTGGEKVTFQRDLPGCRYDDAHPS